jgi:two-component system sensor histidine kinase/response regulator
MVDDEPKNLLALEAVLDSLGHELVRAESGKEALRCLMRDDYAVILLDVQMPEMDGFETATIIRSRERTRYTPIVFLTAVGKTEAEIFRGYEVGAVDYLLKPFAPEILRYKVTVLVELHQKNEKIAQLNVELSELNADLERRVFERTLALEQRSAELLKSNQELAQFAAVASHDLQEPLRTMGTYLELFFTRNSANIDGEDKETLEVVMDSAKRMRQLISDLLVFSQVGHGEQRMEMVDCGDLVAQILEQLKGLVESQGAVIEVGALPKVYAQPVLLGQVFQNLIGNALKFKGHDPAKVRLGAESRGQEIVFWVKDNGIGVDGRYFDKIFKLFRRLHTKDEYEGSGLGLSICKKIVEMHGGRIWLESVPGSGSTFYFSLPSKG